MGIRDWNAIAAHFRRGGPMKHKNTPRGGASNESRDLLLEAEEEGSLFGYPCQECGEGTVHAVEMENYHTKVQGHPFVVPCAHVGVCDSCGAEHFNAGETKRWIALYEAEPKVCRWICCCCGNLLKEDPQVVGLPSQTLKAVGECCKDTLPAHLQSRTMPIRDTEDPKPCQHDQRQEKREEKP